MTQHQGVLKLGLVSVVLALLAVALAPAARAHEIRPAVAELTFDGAGGYAITVMLNIEALVAGIGPKHLDTSQSANAGVYERLRALTPAELGRAFDAFAPQFLAGIAVEVDGRPSPLEVATVTIPEVGDMALARISTVVLTGTLPGGADALTWSWASEFGPSIIAQRGEPTEKDPQGPIVYSDYLLDGARSRPIPVVGPPPQSTLEIFGEYIAIGFSHILPRGLDHILFVTGLFLLNTRFRSLLIQVTSFTVAHTITLALGVFGVVQIPPTIVEPLIAASIVYVCVENVVSDKLQRWRPMVVFGFGLLHGLGFAGVLSEVGLQPAHFLAGLIAFNLGVELAQLTVVLGCFLVVGLWFGAKPYYRVAITIPVSLVIAVIGAAWFVERVAA